jgi:hypothetical protein
LKADFRFKLINCAKGHSGRIFGCALLLVCLFRAVTAAAQPPLDDLKRADWSVEALHDLAHNPPSKEAVWSFIGHLPGRVPDMGKLCDFHFVDLRGQGTLSLVVSDDAGGTVDCNDVEIFDKTSGGIEQYLQPGYLDTPGVEDINGDGRFEVVVYDAAAVEYGGDSDASVMHCEICRTCEESWPIVYAWTGSGYTEVSTQYRKYYERELASVKKQIAAIDGAEAAAHRPAPVVQPPVQVPMAVEPGAFNHGVGSGGGFGASGSQQIGTTQQQQTLESAPAASPTPDDAEPPDPSALDCLRAEAAKIERFLGRSRDAGMNDAIRWANSNSAAEREFASSVLPQIGTAEALRYEQTLSRDSSPDVSDSAKEELEDWGKPENPAAFDRSP